MAFDANSACTILVPEKATEAEMRAARLLQQTLAKAARRPRDDFAIVHRAPEQGRVLSVRGLVETSGPKLEEWVAWRASPGRLELTAYPADAIEAAASWFLEQQLGARWFSPGAIGEHVPARKALQLPVGEASFRPSYFARSMADSEAGLGRRWRRQNKLRSKFSHSHAMSALFKPEDLRANPELAPEISGRRYVPADDKQQGWQPNIVRADAANHAARRLKERTEFSSALGMNDGIGYDQSLETRRQVNEAKWFRMRPDFSPLVFRFTNEVAKQLPERYLGAYAYYWTEDAPSFKVERNVVPYLTADRSEWADATFAAADKALITRWVANGSEVVGLYDYYYGAPFFIPRPTLYAVTEVIPWAHEAGVRAFYAEIYSNWALDGPKAWVAAQLLWNSRASPEALLNTYYTEFWREAAGPMREFYALCDEQWRHQPKPTYWIKYYKDEHQYLLFPREVRQRLRALLERAMAGATTELTRNRLRFVSAGYAVSEAFCTWNETREQLSRATLGQDIRPDEVRALIKDYGAQLESLRQLLAETKRQYPDAIQADLLGEYTRNDPRRRAEWRLAAQSAKREGHSAQNGRQTPDDGGLTTDDNKAKPETGDLRPDGRQRMTDGGRTREGGQLTTNPPILKSSNPSPADPHTFTPSHLHTLSEGRSPAIGPELLRDADLAQLVVGPTSGFFDLKWVQAGPWRGQGEPYQTRRVRLDAQSAKREGQGDQNGRRTTEGGGRRTEDGRRTAEDNKAKPETGDLRPEDGGRRTDDGGRRTEDGRLTADGGSFNPPILRSSDRSAAIVFTGCKQDMLWQVVPGVAGKTYVARVKVQGKVSPGNMTFMILNFQDAQGRTLGLGTIDRLPVGSYDEPVELVCTAVAPPEAVWVGMGVKAVNQVLDDEARFTGLSLREVLAP